MASSLIALRIRWIAPVIVVLFHLHLPTTEHKDTFFVPALHMYLPITPSQARGLGCAGWVHEAHVTSSQGLLLLRISIPPGMSSKTTETNSWAFVSMRAFV